MSILMVPLAAIAPNPYRHIEKYQLSETKLESLIQSYDNSGFWDGSIQARPHPKKAGMFEIAFGHHRVEAARRANIKTLGLVVAKRSNADMLRMMADENRDEFRADAQVAVETIAAVIEAYGRGEIELESVDPRQQREYSVHHLSGGKCYTLGTVARFLGWIKPSDGQATNACREAFKSYCNRPSTGPALASIPSAQRSTVALKTVNTAVTVARKRAEKDGLSPSKIDAAGKVAAKKAADRVIETSGFIARDEARSIGLAAVSEVAPRKAIEPPPIQDYVRRIIREAETIHPYAALMLKCHPLLPYTDDIPSALQEQLADALEKMLARCEKGIQNIIAALRRGDNKKLHRLLEESYRERTIEIV